MRGPALKLAIRAPEQLGDLVQATPILEAAARAARVSILVAESSAPLLADGPLAELSVPLVAGGDEVALYRELAPDAVLLLESASTAAWRAFRARVPVRAGAARGAGRLLLTHTVLPPSRAGRRLPIPIPHLQRDLAGLLGISVPDLRPRLAVRAALRAEWRAELQAAGLRAGEAHALCCPSAVSGAAPAWPPERFAECLDRLYELRGLRAVVWGGPGAETAAEQVVRSSRTGALSAPAAPRDLERLKACVRDAALVLAGDVAARFVAAAFDVPCVALLGPDALALSLPTSSCRALRVAPGEPAYERVVEAALELLGRCD